MLDLTTARLAIRQTLAVAVGETLIYTDDLVTEGLRQALREYELSATPIAETVPVIEAGQTQQLQLALELRQLVAIAWPWGLPEAVQGVDLRERLVRWRPLSSGGETVWIEDGVPQVGDRLLVYYRRAQTVDGLDGAVATSVGVKDQGLLLLGAAGWAAELHYRLVADSVNGPTAEQIKRMYTWAYLRLQEFRNGLRDLQRATPVVRPAWGSIGL